MGWKPNIKNYTLFTDNYYKNLTDYEQFFYNPPAYFETLSKTVEKRNKTFELRIIDYPEDISMLAGPAISIFVLNAALSSNGETYKLKKKYDSYSPYGYYTHPKIDLPYNHCTAPIEVAYFFRDGNESLYFLATRLYLHFLSNLRDYDSFEAKQYFAELHSVSGFLADFYFFYDQEKDFNDWFRDWYYYPNYSKLKRRSERIKLYYDTFYKIFGVMPPPYLAHSLMNFRIPHYSTAIYDDYHRFVESTNVAYIMRGKSEQSYLDYLTENHQIDLRKRNVDNDLRTKVMLRDRGVCKVCGSTTDLNIDHIEPYDLGGETTIDNLQVLCRKCNIKKTNKKILYI